MSGFLKGQIIIGSASSAPTSPTPTNGQMYYNTSDNKLYSRVNGAWVEVGGGSDFPKDIPSSGKVLHLDANDSSSYGGSGTTWSDLAGNYDFTVNASSFTSATGGAPAYFDFSANTTSYMAYNSGGVTRNAANTVVMGWYRGPMRVAKGYDDYVTRIALSQKKSIGYKWQLGSSSNTRQIFVYNGGTRLPDQWGAHSGDHPQNRQPEFGPDSENVANMITWRTQSTDSSNTPTFQCSINTCPVAGSTNSNMTDAESVKLFHNIGNFSTDSTTGDYGGFGLLCFVIVYSRLITTAEEMQIYAHYQDEVDFVKQGVYAMTGGF